MRVLRYRGRDITKVRPVECPKCTSPAVNPSRFVIDRFFCLDCLHDFTKKGRNSISEETDTPRFAVFHTALDDEGNTDEPVEIGRFATYNDACKVIGQHRDIASEWEYDTANQRWCFRIDHGPATAAGRYAWQEYYYLHIGRPT